MNVMAISEYRKNSAAGRPLPSFHTTSADSAPVSSSTG
jgi:hypothetical protein